MHEGWDGQCTALIVAIVTVVVFGVAVTWMI